MKTLLMRRPLVEVSIVHSSLYIYIYIANFVLFNIGLATMKENKEKAITSGTEGEEDVQVLDDATPLVV